MLNKNIIKGQLKELSDENYKKFHSSLCPTNDKDIFLGVRVPVIKDYAKKLLKEYKNNIDELLENIDDYYYEEIMLQGLVISLSNLDLEKKIYYSRKFIPKIINWAICDVFCASFKFKKSEEDIVWDFINEYKNSDSEYETRFLIVMLLNHFIDEKKLDNIFEIIEEVNSDKYYVKIASAWCISVCYIKFSERTKKYLNNSKLDKWTYNKSIQKIIESRRIDEKEKDKLRKLKH